MTVKLNNCTFLWGTLVVVLLPALVHSVPISIVEQQAFPLEEPHSLQKIEEISIPNITPISPNVDVATVTGVLEEISNELSTVVTLAPILQLPVVSTSTSNVALQRFNVEPLSLLAELATKLDTPLVEEFVPVDELPTSPINNLDTLVEHQTISTPVINEIEDVVKEKPVIETYDVNHPLPITTTSDEDDVLRGGVLNTVELQYNKYLTGYEALPVKDESNLSVNKIDNSLVSPTTVVPVSKEELLEFERFKKSSSHKKQALFKIIIKIIHELLIKECNFPVEEVNEALVYTDPEELAHNVAILEEISSNEKELLLKQVNKAMARYLWPSETGAIESANLENVISSSSEEEDPKSSSVEQVHITALSEEPSYELLDSQSIEEDSENNYDVIPLQGRI